MKSAKNTNPDTQQRIVEATVRCVKKWGIAKVTLNDIAKEAGVTRPTVYSYFSNRDEVVQFAMLQSAYGFAQKLLRHIEEYESPEERTIEAVMFALKRLPNEPYLELMADSGLADIMNENALRAEEGNEIRRSIFRLIFRGLDVEGEELDEIVEVSTRFVLSLLTVKSEKKRSDKEMRAFLCRRLLPALGLDPTAAAVVKLVKG
ncbi:TetR/AcrR family transcriptional regulator [Ketobacter sp.]|uniref:TetR/AcrR family transcriptional regulator n=1 Tax=Ketobacter sp. TaxID=2083498 RepID=UPI000F298CA6|nr:TetR/AcrR family transcriptional regulator [Ketobacter sp.]MEE2733431.1 TetR/AcrR family transcriptional regulator [Pseudomonadota bacterium]RLT93063.1 MAG: TetR/AcrR family transcriptional regulator [Ketobacter sp.]